MIALATAMSFSGFVALYLAMHKHHAEHFGALRASPARLHLLRLGGWIGLASAFAICVGVHGWAIGPVSWLGAMTVAGLVLTLALRPYRPNLIVPLALAAPPLASLVALLPAS